jgi:predicted component of type VI protein secretion system
MNFKLWIETEASLGSGTPEMVPGLVNRGSDTPASDEVKRTGMQPQVDSQEVRTKEKDEQDKLMAVDAGIQRLDSEIPEAPAEDFPKISRFKELWKKLKDEWDNIKMGKGPEQPQEPGLAFDGGDQKYTDMMRQFPNMVPAADKVPHGPGIFGQS